MGDEETHGIPPLDLEATLEQCHFGTITPQPLNIAIMAPTAITDTQSPAHGLGLKQQAKVPAKAAAVRK